MQSFCKAIDLCERFDQQFVAAKTELEGSGRSVSACGIGAHQCASDTATGTYSCDCAAGDFRKVKLEWALHPMTESIVAAGVSAPAGVISSKGEFCAAAWPLPSSSSYSSQSVSVVEVLFSARADQCFAPELKVHKPVVGWPQQSGVDPDRTKLAPTNWERSSCDWSSLPGGSFDSVSYVPKRENERARRNGKQPKKKDRYLIRVLYEGPASAPRNSYVRHEVFYTTTTAATTPTHYYYTTSYGSSNDGSSNDGSGNGATPHSFLEQCFLAGITQQATPCASDAVFEMEFGDQHLPRCFCVSDHLNYYDNLVTGGDWTAEFRGNTPAARRNVVVFVGNRGSSAFPFAYDPQSSQGGINRDSFLLLHFSDAGANRGSIEAASCAAGGNTTHSVQLGR